MTLASVLLIGMAGLVTDGSLAYVHRRQMQNAADSAALAGTAVLRANYKTVCSVETTARQKAIAAATENGVALESQVTVRLVDKNGVVTPTCNSAATMGVQVEASQPYGTYFARVLGINQMSAAAIATANYGFVSSLSTTSSSIGILPVALASDTIPAMPYNDGVLYSLQPANSGNSGNFTNYSTFGSLPGGQTLSNAMANGVTGPIVIGDPYSAGSLSATDPTVLPGLQARIASAPSETSTSAKPDSRRVAVVFIRDSNSGGSTMTILGVATVFIDEATSNTFRIHFISVSLNASGSTIDPSITNTSAEVFGDLSVMKLSQ